MMLSSVLDNFPDINELVNQKNRQTLPKQMSSNMHIHTSYSFSAFADITEAVRLAKDQGISVLGISDFNTTEGYDEFTDKCLKFGVFPAYGMETIALSVEDQKSGVRWNDPNNPGRIYFCGKGFQYPLVCGQKTIDTLNRISKSLDKQVRQMIEKLNAHLMAVLPVIGLNYEYIRDNMTEGTVRERHLAKALYLAISKTFPDISEKLKALEALYGKAPQADLTDGVSIQEELRSNLLKAGKVAFVEESPEAYLSIEEAKAIMLDMKGIPCYPVLLDGTKGQPTEIENNPEALCDQLIQKGIYCAEFIPTRNNIDLLRNYVSVFNDRGIALTAGTEHNTPRMEPMKPSCRGGVELGEMLSAAFWKGACVVAAHQYLTKTGRTGYVDERGNRTDMTMEKLTSIGESVIAYYLNM